MAAGNGIMKVFLCLCAWIGAVNAHVIGYPVAPLGYQISPITTIPRPVVTYTGFHGYPLPYFTYGVIPHNVVFPGIPGVVHFIPVAPGDGKGKPENKPKDKEEKDKKEETTEEPKKEEEEEGETKTDETEDLEQ